MTANNYHQENDLNECKGKQKWPGVFRYSLISSSSIKDESPLESSSDHGASPNTFNLSLVAPISLESAMDPYHIAACIQ